MKYTKTKMCDECPFKKGALKGWLGGDDPSTVITRVHGEVGYPCHMDMVGKPIDKDGTTILGDVEQCVGAILHANKTSKLYRNLDLGEMQNRLVNSIEEDNVLGFEFKNYHTIKIKREDK